jgi:hypothetical protein
MALGIKTARMNPTLPPRYQQEHEQCHGEHNTHSQRVQHAFRVAFVVNQVKQAHAQTCDNTDQTCDDDKLNHG